MSKRITNEIFKKIKRETRLLRSTKTIATRHYMSEKTVLQIRGCKNYEEYQENNRAQHPPVRYSLADEVKRIHQHFFDNEAYTKPLTAKQAIADIQSVLPSHERGVHASKLHKRGS